MAAGRHHLLPVVMGLVGRGALVTARAGPSGRQWGAALSGSRNGTRWGTPGKVREKMQAAAVTQTEEAVGSSSVSSRGHVAHQAALGVALPLPAGLWRLEPCPPQPGTPTLHPVNNRTPHTSSSSSSSSSSNSSRSRSSGRRHRCTTRSLTPCAAWRRNSSPGPAQEGVAGPEASWHASRCGPMTPRASTMQP
jgi:hypothetical protein